MHRSVPIVSLGGSVRKSCLLRLDGIPHASPDLQKEYDNAECLSNYSPIASLPPSNDNIVGMPSTVEYSFFEGLENVNVPFQGR